jgi:DNA-binding SARP family transcriptional activator/TolB-like protein
VGKGVEAVAEADDVTGRPSSPAKVSLQLLGTFEFSIDGIAVPISSRRGRALLAYLALRDAFSESRERLATLLWGDRQDRHARQSLRQCLLSLHKELATRSADVLRIEMNTVALDGARIVVDALRFPALARSDAPSNLNEAINLYRGDFLDGLRIESEPFQEWLGGERARLRSLAQLALQKAAFSSATEDGGIPAIAAAERLVGLDPLNEGAQRQLLTLLWRYGGRDVALTRAEEFLRLLHDELGTEPDAATCSLIEAIRRDSAITEKPIPASAIPERGVAAVAPNRPSVLASVALRPWRRGFFVAVGVAAAAALVLTGYRFRPLWLAPAERTAPAASASLPKESWKPPGILADIGADPANLSGSGISAVIVLPFDAVPNGDGGGANRRLVDRITDDLTADLSRLPQIRVIARQTSRLYSGQPVDVGALGTELGVRYVVEGRVQLQDPTLRIDASLIAAASRLEIWSQRFERDYEDRFAAQDELTNALARALHLGVIAFEDRRRPPGTHDDKVDDLLAHGWAAMAHLVNLGTVSGADGYFEKALGRDPENVSALIGLGGYHASVVAMFLVPDPDEHLERAETLLQKAIARSPSSAMAYYYLGLVHKARGQSQQALTDFTKVVHENPSLPLGYAQVGHLVSRMGRPDEAIEYIRYAVRLNPKDPNMGLVGLMAGEIELERGNDAAALDWFKRSLTLAPISPFAHAAMGAALALSGSGGDAAKEVEEVRRLAPWLTVDRMIARLVATSERNHEPVRLIDGLRREFATR